MNPLDSPAKGLAASPHSVRGTLSAALLLLTLAASGCGASANPEEEARIEEGRRVFVEVAQPVCSTCHTLQHAGATGMVGPNLDQLRPDSQRVAAAVTTGVGIMPSQADQLTPEQIGAVAHYVASVAGGERQE